MDRDKLKEIFSELGIDTGKSGRYKDSGDNVQFCCPFHHERRPSAGMHVYDEFGGCFGCGETFTLEKLVAHCMDFTITFRTLDGGKETKYDYFPFYIFLMLQRMKYIENQY